MKPQLQESGQYREAFQAVATASAAPAQKPAVRLQDICSCYRPKI